MSAPAKIHDVLIIGAGPGGLSTALALARQLYSAVVFDSEQYRSSPAEHMHNVLTWDHTSPVNFRATAKAGILARYKTIRFENTRIESIRKNNDGTFETVDVSGNKTTGKKVVLATGVTDVLPEIDGFRELWGKSIFHCLVCHGYEEAGGLSAGVLAAGHVTDPRTVLHLAGMAAPLARNLTVYTNGDESVTQAILAACEDKRVSVEPRKIKSIKRKDDKRSDVIISFEFGESRDETFMVAVPPSKVNGPFVEQLSVKISEEGLIEVKAPFNLTSVPGVFAVGDCATPFKAVVQAMAMGTFAAAGVIAELGQYKLSIGGV